MKKFWDSENLYEATCIDEKFFKVLVCKSFKKEIVYVWFILGF